MSLSVALLSEGCGAFYISVPISLHYLAVLLSTPSNESDLYHWDSVSHFPTQVATTAIPSYLKHSLQASNTDACTAACALISMPLLQLPAASVIKFKSLLMEALWKSIPPFVEKSSKLYKPVWMLFLFCVLALLAAPFLTVG